MATNVQWAPSMIVRNLMYPGGNSTKALSDYGKLPADEMAIVLGCIRHYADSMTFTAMTNTLIHKVSAPNTSSYESERGNAFLEHLKIGDMNDSQSTLSTDEE